MSVLKPVDSAQITSSAQMVTSSTGYKYKVKGVWVMGGATNGTVVLKDGGSSGVAKLTLNVPGITTSGTTFGGYCKIPGDGIIFNTDVYGTLTTAAGCTVFYETIFGGS